MIATLRHLLIRVPARLVRHAGSPILRLPPDDELLDEVPHPKPTTTKSSTSRQNIAEPLSTDSGLTVRRPFAPPGVDPQGPARYG
jgi:hypothetical protein